MPPLTYFLIVFDSEQQKLVEARDVGTDRAAALTAYGACEDEYGMSRFRLQIVLLGAESLDAIRRTHSQYFSASADDPFADLART